MTGTSSDRQPELLEDYWNTLRADPTAPPPAALDAATADLVRELERELHPPELDAAFVSGLRSRLQPSSLVTPGNGAVPPLPPIATDFKRVASDDGSTSVADETRGSGFWQESLKMAAAIVGIGIVGTVLVLLFHDSDQTKIPAGENVQPTGAPATETRQPAAAPPAEPGSTPTIIPSHASTPSSDITSTPTGELLIPLRSDGGEQRLFVVSADGTQSRQLIPEGTLEGDQTEGVWSPDGSQVAFTVQRGSPSDLYIVDADGSNLRQLAPTPPRDPDPERVLTQGNPAWSPDGTKIAFASSRAWDRGGLDIYVVNSDGSNLERLTDSELFESSPRWSPDGSMIAFEAMGGSADHYGNVYVMNADGSDRRRLVETIGARDPNWSPTGEWIAYSDGRFGSVVHIVRVDGTEQRDLTGIGMVADSPRWSPDGSLLAWSAHVEGGSLDGIFVREMVTGQTRHISNLAGRLEWSPDGTWLVVAYPKLDTTGDETGESGLYLVKPDGSREEPMGDLPVPGYITLDWRIAGEEPKAQP